MHKTLEEQRERFDEEYTFLVAIGHRTLQDGRIVDGRAEGLFSLVKAVRGWSGPYLDVDGLTCP